MSKTYLVITSIAGDDNPVLRKFSKGAAAHKIQFIVVGDNKSPGNFMIEGCDYYSVIRQQALKFKLAGLLPINHYSRKNIGYLAAMAGGAEKIIETDDDNLPLPAFWDDRSEYVDAHLIENDGWVNIYKYFTDQNIWPRGFPLEHIVNKLPEPGDEVRVICPIQQGLADDNPDVDAIYRFILPLPVRFNKAGNFALGKNSICPFNSQNTTWFRSAFTLMYLPSYCSFRMTDIWRSFVAQRIAWTCGWSIMFHDSTVKQERNDHNLLKDFNDEIPGYSNNNKICMSLLDLKLKEGPENINENMILCYQMLTDFGFVGKDEIILLKAWLYDVSHVI